MSDRLTERIERLAGSPVPIPPLDGVRHRRDARVRHRRAAGCVLAAAIVAGAGGGWLVASGADRAGVSTRPVSHRPTTSPSPPLPRSLPGVPDRVMLRLRDLPAGFSRGDEEFFETGTVDALRVDCGALTSFHDGTPPRDPSVVAQREDLFAAPGNNRVDEAVRVYRPGSAASAFGAIREAVRTCATSDWSLVPSRPFAGEADLLARGYSGAAYAAVLRSGDVIASVTVRGGTPSERSRLARQLALRAASRVCAIGGGSCD